MNDCEIRHLQKRIDSLEDNIRKQSNTNLKKFIWLFMLSNLIFWIIIGHISLKHGLDRVESKLTPKELKICYQLEDKNT